jgi:hypothetical protein
MEIGREGGRVMKRIVLIALLCFLLSGLLIGWAWAQGSGEGQEPEGEQAEAEELVVEEPVKPSVMWGDYIYTFRAVGPSADLDPQSVIINWFSPSIYNANWSAANYVHLNMTVDWVTNDRPLDYMPLQLILHSGGRSFILFGKAGSSESYLWRRGNHYGNDVGARYPNHVGDDARLFFTFHTRGAAIDPHSAYIEVRGMLEVWDWNKRSKLYVDRASADHYWYRYGSSYFTYTHLADIPLRDILPEQ